MNEIKLLDKSTISKIAAGEIITRPLNVVKELVENSIDAGADTVVISLNGSEICVEDNGCGIDKDDIQTAFMRHATSKIVEEKDLSGIASLGFRGEALFAIAHVAEVELFTKTAQDAVGTRFIVRASEPKSMEEAAANQGTKIIVRDLFFNLPVRKKHLKNASYERRLIATLIEQLAVVNSAVSFTLTIDGRKRLYTSKSGNIKTAAYEVYGRDFTTSSIDFDYIQTPLSVKGLLSDLSAKSRKVRIISINGRLVQSKSIYASVKSAYEELRGEGSGEADYILSIQLPYEMVDVNVHPSKDEVRFGNESLVYMLIKNAVKEALSNTKHYTVPDQKAPVLTPPSAEPSKNEPFSVPKTYDTTSIMRILDGETQTESVEMVEETLETEKQSAVQQTFFSEESEESVLKAVYDTDFKEEAPFINRSTLDKLRYAKFAGHFFNTYILLELEEKLYIIDQHAAHERVMYEKLLKAFKEEQVERQYLMMPVQMPLSLFELLCAKENLDLLTRLGYDITLEEAGLLITAVPIIGGKAQSTSVLLEVLQSLKDFNDTNYEARHERIIKAACVAAVKADRVLGEEEIILLIEEFCMTDTPFICPHGRNTMYVIRKKEIDKLFGRQR